MWDQKNGGDHGDDVNELSASDDSEPEEQPSSAPFDPELDDDDDDDEEEEEDRKVEISAPLVGHKGQSSFSLRGGTSAFSNRSHSIFDCLDSVARLASSSLPQDNLTDGVFARPLPPPPSRKVSQPSSSCPIPAKRRGAPDYLVHPERWTHYSLEDVTETSDQSNRKAAHHFLASLQQRKEEPESRSDSSCNIQQKMIFSRPSGLPKEQPPTLLSAVRGKEKETRLSHLEDDDDDEDGSEKKKAGGNRTDQSAEKAEEKDTRGAVGRPEVKKRVQREEEEEDGEKEKEEEEEDEDEDEEGEKIDEPNPSFTPFRKTKHKNYRKSSGQEDN
ncbi:U5 small nuclear ribonucleoprotein TSSC4 [Pempheris klunzingeri]|uniref:U5 small nuclear ribonucleoprotein TSSC4 n=1 Tax=Pempheris klunzingeri TaxID=3127111 RepID=UPI00397FECE6